MRIKRWGLLSGVPSLLLVALLAAGCQREKPAAPAARAAEVGVITVALRDVPIVFEFVGETESSQQVEIRSRVNGFLEQRVYTEGAVVKAGDVLFRMDPKPFRAALEAANAALALQQARLSTAQANLNRVRPLAARNALSQKDLDDSIGQEKAAAAAVEEAKANVISAKLNLGYTTITTPVSGLSSFAKRQVGTYIDTTNSLLTYVAKLDPMWVNFSLSENEVLQSRAQQEAGTLKLPPRGALEVEIILADGTVYPSRGRIAFADASFNSQTGTYLVRAEMKNPDSLLRPGQFVRVKLIGAMRTKAVAVPQEAVVQGQRGETVWTVDKDGKAQPRVIEVGEWSGGEWVVKSGLRPGDLVIVSGALRLAPGAPVKPIPAASGAASGAQAAGPASRPEGSPTSNIRAAVSDAAAAREDRKP